MSTRGPETILVVDDDDALRTRLLRAFRDRGYQALGAADAAQAWALTAEQGPDLAVVDLRMPGGSGLELISVLHSSFPALRIVVLTGYGSIATALDAVRSGALDYLTKPADADQILEALRSPGRREPAPASQAPSLWRVEWEHIQRVLHDCGGNVSQAARVLGVHRRTLQRKLATLPPQR